MKANEYRVMEEAVEIGLGYGWRRAHKHVESPSESSIIDEMHTAVMNEITGWFTFDDRIRECEKPAHDSAAHVDMTSVQGELREELGED